MAAHILILVLTAVLMLTGLVGSVLPGLPGSPLIFIGAFIYAWYTGFEVISWMTLGWLFILTILSHFLDFLASAIGVKKFGGSRWGVTGALLGGVIGIFTGGLLGLILGSFLGAILLELVHGQTMEASLKIGLGSLVGFLGGTIGKVVIALLMIGIFWVKVIGS